MTSSTAKITILEVDHVMRLDYEGGAFALRIVTTDKQNFDIGFQARHKDIVGSNDEF